MPGSTRVNKNKPRKEQHRERVLRHSDGNYRALIEQASDGIFLSDPEGRFILVNRRGCELLGYTEEELLLLNGRDTYVEEEREQHAERMARVRQGEELRFERMVKRKDGSTFPAEVSIKRLDNSAVQVIFRDISLRLAQEQKILRLSRIHGVLSGINSAIVRIRDKQELFNEACRIAAKHGQFWLAWIGLLDEKKRLRVVASAGEGVQAFADLASHPDPNFSPEGVAQRALTQNRTIIDNDILANPRLDAFRARVVEYGCRSVIALPISSEGKLVGTILFYSHVKDFFDEEEIKLLEELAGDVSFALTFIGKQEKVTRLAFFDPLTELPNQTLLYDRVAQQLKTATRDGRVTAFILLDLERFHGINDSLGRAVGDKLLQEVGRRLRASVRSEDTVARVSSDKFAVVMVEVNSTTDIAHSLRYRVLNIFREPIKTSRQALRLSAKAGVALAPDDGDTPEVLHSNAEAALKRAKQVSDPFVFYSPDMNASVAESLTLENKLRTALDKRHFVLYYQPKVVLPHRKISGLEALIRWNDPELGLVPPAKFISILEKTGLILDAGRWALSQVAVDCRQWVGQGLSPPPVAVNVSPVQLKHKDFVTTVLEAVHRAHNAHGALELEITESVIMENLEETIHKLQALRGAGVNVSVDDFGTGYSSLAYVARLPIHGLKIDRSFVSKMTDSRESLAIVRSVISLAHSLRLEVIAEGVETEEQAAALEGLSCDQLQGYLFSRPVPPTDIPGLLTRQLA
jgi:diguanylate cyclase (GGDEF)-like protein/PAS domain S-box-containing protein